MLELLQSWDTALLLKINGCHTVFLDGLMWVLSAPLLWIPLYLAICYLIYRKFGGRAALWIVALLLVNFGLADFIGGHLLRDWVLRLRPSNPENPVSSLVQLVNHYHGGTYGFPSCHAANSMSLAVLFSLIYRNRWAAGLLLFWSFVHSFTRIYLGVHYPGDVLAGWILGAVLALILYFGIYKKFLAPRLDCVA